jgi:succinoglycan biosynthesis transport protein ExoP
MPGNDNGDHGNAAAQAGLTLPGAAAGQPAAPSTSGWLDPFAGGALTSSAARGRGPTVAMLWRQKWLALLVFAVLSIPLVAAVWWLHVPLYEARAVVEVSPRVPRLVYATEDNGLIPLYQQYLNSQAAVIRSPVVLNRVLDKVRDTAWYRQPRMRPPFSVPLTQLERLQEDLTVSLPPKTSLVVVKMTAGDPREAARIVNTVVEEYGAYVLDRARESEDLVLRAVSQEYRDLRDQIEQLKESIAARRAALLHWTPEELLGQQRNRLDAKEADLEMVRDELRIARWEYEQLSGAGGNPESQPTSAPVADLLAQGPPYDSDPEWRRLHAELRAAEQSVALAQHLGESHPDMVRMRKAVELARTGLEARQARLDELWETRPPALAQAGAEGDPRRARLAELEMQIGRLERTLALKTAGIAQQRAQVTETAATAAELEKDLNELQHLEERYEEVRRRKFTMDMERQAPASVRVQSQAYPPTQASNGRRRLILLAGAVLGSLGMGIIAAWLRARTVRSVQYVDELEHGESLPFLGHVPVISSRGDKPDAMQAECVRMIRTALFQRLDEGRGNVIQVTSAGPGAGKTTLALLLADSLVRCGKKVLLVDGDVRNPNVHRRCGTDSGPGLIGVLANRVHESEAMVRFSDSNMYVLPAGQRQTAGDGELLANGVLARALRGWSQRFDVVLIDSSPVLPVADARILARNVDGTIMVVRQGHCERNEVAAALRQLRDAGGRLMGVVFIGSPRGSGDYSGYYYHDYFTPAGGGVTLDVNEAGVR